jgi:catechol 1,2-dioxygenase
MNDAKMTTLAAWTWSISATSPPRVSVARLSRRALLGVLGAIGGGLTLALRRDARADMCSLGARNPIEGPYYLGDPEEKTDTGSELIVRGVVRDETTCLPIPGATIVRWHANDVGEYEEFYRARMHPDAQGRYAMSSIAPGQYANLDRHIHWFVTAEGYRPLTAQIQWANGATIGPEATFDFALTRA